MSANPETVAVEIAPCERTGLSPIAAANLAAWRAEKNPTLRQYVMDRLNESYKDIMTWGHEGRESVPISYVSRQDDKIKDIINAWRHQITKTFIAKIYEVEEVKYDEEEKEYTVWFYWKETIEIDDAELPK